MNLDTLNKEQRHAAETLTGPLLILAGAGSGKTRTLTYRVANLLEHGVPAWSIMAITFTNKAAAEMRDRIRLMVGDAAEDIWISTFHSSCAKILRRDIEKLGYDRSFTIYDDDDQMTVIKECLKKLNLDEKVIQPRTVKSMISDAKNRLLGPEDWFAQCEKDYQSQRMMDIYTAYEERLKSANALDFDDLLMKTLELFVSCPPVLEAYQHKFHYIHVDEYQDTNYAQYMFVKLLADRHHNLCVVGDDDQSIYGWRGADISNILDFEKDYPEATVIKLEQNYRSSANILDAANQVIAQNEARKDKALWTEKGPGEKVTFCRLQDEREEAAWVAGKIADICKTASPSDIGVLYRTNSQSRILEEQFVRMGMKYKIYGGLRFYERKEVKDILAYLRILANPADDVSLRRIINVPKRAIGDSTVNELVNHAASQNMPLLSACMDIPETLGARARGSVQKFSQLIMDLSLYMNQMPVSEFVEKVIRDTGLEEQYKEESDENTTRRENIHEFIGAVTEYQEKTENATLADFLENVALVSDLDDLDQEGGALTLMTLHSAKGLEFPYVFIVGMEENLFPSARCTEDSKKLEEERRLCYVGITRAKQKLYLTCAARRMLYNQLQFNDRSRFLDDIPKRVLSDETPRSASPRGSFGGSGRLAQPAWSTSAFRTQPRPQPRPQPQNPPGSVLWRKGEAVPDFSSGIRSKASAAPGPKPEVVHSAAEAVPVSDEFAAGDRILHRKFGQGVILRISGDKGDRRALVRFDDAQYGTKQLSLGLAPIVKVK